MHKVGKTHPKAHCAEKTVMNTSPLCTVFVSVFRAKRKAHIFQLTAVLLSNVGTPFALAARKLPRMFLAQLQKQGGVAQIACVCESSFSCYLIRTFVSFPFL